MATIHAQSGHTLHVEKIEAANMPAFESKENYKTFYIVRNRDKQGVVFFYLAKGYKGPMASSSNEIVGWYRNGKFWSSFGKTLKAAVDGMQKDGWLYAC